jgi:hypothetical protein
MSGWCHEGKSRVLSDHLVATGEHLGGYRVAHTAPGVVL